MMATTHGYVGGVDGTVNYLVGKPKEITDVSDPAHHDAMCATPRQLPCISVDCWPALPQGETLIHKKRIIRQTSRSLVGTSTPIQT